ncbi:MAG: S8 family serine peptidase [Thermoanaerobaculum sp.]
MAGAKRGFVSVLLLVSFPCLGTAWQEKVDPQVIGALATSGEAEFLVVLRAQADTGPARTLPSKEARGQWVFETLKATAEATQGPVLQLLTEHSAPYRAFWIANMVWAKGNEELVRRLAELPDVREIVANPKVSLPRPQPAQPEPASPEGVEWGISKTGAPAVWNWGFKGQGVVIGGQDTGYQWDHPALKTKYRGWNGTTADHNYNWHDAIHSGGGVCGADSPVPCDDDSHGTHTMGTMVGDDGGTNQIGMAPLAKWIGCRNMDQGVGTPATYAECFQWFVAPTDLNGQNPDPSRAPHVINNSWGCPASEGCTNPAILQAVVENTRNAGIVVVVSAGNSGSSCGSVDDPPAIYDAAYSVGATSSSDTIASFSSRGPVTVDGSGRMKPDISAPGVSVRSSVPGGGYATFSGTSMAGPHVAGAVALLLSSAPSWKGQVDLIESRLSAKAFRGVTPTGQTCGGIPDTQFPNNTYGWGRVDVLAALNEADLAVTLADAPDPVPVGGNLVYTATVTNQSPFAATGLTASLSLPPTATYVSGPLGCAVSGSTVTCQRANLGGGQQWVLAVTVHPTSAGTITASVTVTATQSDPNTANNAAQTSTTVSTENANLVATLQVSPSDLVVQDPATLTLGVTNAGSGLAVAVQATVTLPSGLAAEGLPADCSPAGNVVTCALGNLNSMTSASRSFTVRPQAEGSFAIIVSASSTSGETNPSDNQAEASLLARQLQPKALAVAEDGAGNGIFEPGETVLLSPTWANPAVASTTQGGTVFGFGGPSGADYQIVTAGATYPTIPGQGEAPCSSCYVVAVTPTGPRPATHWDAQITEQLASTASKTWVLHLGGSFADIPGTSPFYPYVETVLHRGITAGCDSANFCPENPVNRWQMAVFLARTLHPDPLPDSGTVPGLGNYSCTPGGFSVFADVAPTDPGCRAIHYLAAQGITLGCGGGNFCPTSPTTRRQMAVFLTRALVGDNPPPAGEVPGLGAYNCVAGGQSVFADVLPDEVTCPHIHFIAAEGITKGCGGGNYCPEQSTRRDQMAAFLTRAFALALYGP